MYILNLVFCNFYSGLLSFALLIDYTLAVTLVWPIPPFLYLTTAISVLDFVNGISRVLSIAAIDWATAIWEPRGEVAISYQRFQSHVILYPSLTIRQKAGV